MEIKPSGSLYNVCPGIVIDEYSNVKMLKKILDISISKKVPLHLWFHFWSFGQDKNIISEYFHKLFIPFLSYAQEKSKEDVLEVKTMLSAAQKFQRMNNVP